MTDNITTSELNIRYLRVSSTSDMMSRSKPFSRTTLTTQGMSSNTR
jgi:hypothetical protein